MNFTLFAGSVMWFEKLRASAAMSLESYVDLDHFRESERYAQAESMPLSVKDFCAMRARLALPSCTLSLVRTFPRIINGFGLLDRLVIVVPMNDVSSTRLNGKPVGQSLILIKGQTSCTVVEPEGRLVAILSIARLDRGWSELSDGHRLLRLSPAGLAQLQLLIRSALEFAGTEADAFMPAGVRESLQETLFAAFDEAVRCGLGQDRINAPALARYKMMVDRVDQLIALNPLDASNEKLAEETGISLRTLQTASRAVTGLAVHRYSRLKRLWLVRRQLRSGAIGLTVKASAMAHGFWHVSQFTSAYRASFGELPSETLAQARRRAGTPRSALNLH